jgi:acyl-CoA reductase-like NAD-dependent aldehyde dehydrogenase
MLMNPQVNAAGSDVAAIVDGKPAYSRSTATMDVINPSNGRRCLTIPVGCDVDVDCAVANARRAFDDGRWNLAAPSLRKRVLHELASLIEGHAAELDALDAAEMGKPVSEPFGGAKVAAALMRFHAEAVDKVLGDVYGSDRNSFVAQRWVPRGVVAAIVPWNFPAYVTVLKAAPALAAGNCLVLKPSEMSSRSALRIAQLALQAGVPPGVFNVVPGLGETVGRALGLHMDVDMVTFTGSTDVGRLMLQYAGQSNLKVVMAECGGKSPQIVFDDGVDLDAAADTIARTLLTNQGQICSVGTRLLVQRSIEHAIVERIEARFQRVVMGDASDPATTFGPLASAKQCERVMRYIGGAADDGAQLVTGGRRALEERGGFFVEPTLFRGVSPGAPIAREEIFGPVLAVMPFHDVDEAIRIANSTAYGLAAYVWTADLSTGMRMMKGVRSTLWVNATAPVGEGAGFVGSSEPVGMSGVGTECGLAGMQSYMRRQRVTFNHA